jgi:hypothetical protein
MTGLLVVATYVALILASTGAAWILTRRLARGDIR